MNEQERAKKTPSFMAATGSSSTRDGDNKEKIAVGRTVASASAGDIGRFGQKRSGCVRKDSLGSKGGPAAKPVALLSSAAEVGERKKNTSAKPSVNDKAETDKKSSPEKDVKPQKTVTVPGLCTSDPPPLPVHGTPTMHYNP